MRKASSAITPEGYPIIGLTALSSFIFALVGCWPVAVLFLVMVWFSAHFFRDPERVIPKAQGIAVCPADGKIIRIEPRTDPFTGRQARCISIFMNVFNVHVNRSPLDCQVNAIRYHQGRFFNAALDKASTDNERCAYQLKDTEGQLWTMVQISGLIAQRIVCRVEEGDNLARGERYGMIKFGSRVDVYLPDAYAPSVNIGDKVLAGQSILAHRLEA